MCVVSAVSDYYRHNTLPATSLDWSAAIANPLGYQVQIDQMRKDIEALRQLLIAAQKYDKAVGEPHCEDPEKVALIRKIAEVVGVDLKGIF